MVSFFTVYKEILDYNLKIPIILNKLIRVKATLPQSKLNFIQRKNNTKNAFLAKNSCAGAHIVLFDDVITTMNTIYECAYALKAAGAIRIDAWCIARA